MCTVCGCSETPKHTHHHPASDQQADGDNQHTHEHTHDHSHKHDNTDATPQLRSCCTQGHTHTGRTADSSPLDSELLHYGKGPARAHAPGLDQSRMVQIEQDILGKNNQYAEQNRALFAQKGIFALNLVSSPGSGKTTLLTRTLNDLKAHFSLTVIEGDQETSQDAERIRETGVASVQINTGKGCHLDAHMVGHAVTSLAPVNGSLMFIENVGNLVCPAAFDLGEDHKVAILSVTEGEDKPIKYPDMFHAADLLLLNKVDLLPYLDFDVDKCIAYARRVNPKIRVLQVSAQSGAGMSNWYQWLTTARQQRLIEHANASAFASTEHASV